MSAENNVNMLERKDCVLKKSNMTPWGRASATRFISKQGSDSFRKENISKNCVNVIDF